MPQLQAALFIPLYTEMGSAQGHVPRTSDLEQEVKSIAPPLHPSLAISSLGTGTSAQAMLQVYSKHPSHSLSKRAEKE